MKRLKLDDFKSKKVTQKNKQLLDQALGQVLGDCHDQPKSDSLILDGWLPLDY